MNRSTAQKLIKLGWNEYVVNDFLLLPTRKKGRFKMVITGDRKDYDDLSELAEHPERGVYLDTQYFDYPDQAVRICDTYEGYFYRLYSGDELIDSGTVDVDFVFDAVREATKHDSCCKVCKFCFFRGYDCSNFSCEKEDN